MLSFISNNFDQLFKNVLATFREQWKTNCKKMEIIIEIYIA